LSGVSDRAKTSFGGIKFSLRRLNSSRPRATLDDLPRVEATSDSSPKAFWTRHRADLQGLRAVAVLLVALDHAHVGFLQGGYVGVDVFFVLSGFLITGVLVSSAAHEAARGKFFAGFYARRARRILPAAALTLIATDVAASHLLSLDLAHQTYSDSISAMFFVANFHFASLGTNYFAMNQPPSPLQHYWSLSVEEQFYLVWPLMIAVTIFGVGRLRLATTPRPPMAALSRGAIRRLQLVALVVTCASLVYGIYYTNHLQAAAYFSSVGRAWELGLGALLAFMVAVVDRISPLVRAVVGWAGVAAILAASVLFSASTPFPGTAALLPALGAVAVIGAGISRQHARLAPTKLLSLRPLQYVGDRSYTFYLWHWPVLILATEHVGHSLTVTTNLLLLAGAFALSVVTYRFFENPIRHAARFRSSAALWLWPAAVSIVVFFASINWSDYADAVNAAIVVKQPALLKEAVEPVAEATSTEQVHGWRPSSTSVLRTSVEAVHRGSLVPSELTPPALTLRKAEYKVPSGCIALPGETTSSPCELGDTTSQKTLVLFGDSHALMWVPAVVAYAQRYGYVVRPVLKYSCDLQNWDRAECVTWRRWAIKETRSLRPKLVLLGTFYNAAPETVSQTLEVARLTAMADGVRSATSKVVLIGDPPGVGKEPASCLLATGARMSTCSYQTYGETVELTGAAEDAADSFGAFLDTTPWFCFHDVCPMVIGHTIAYFDPSHITTQYAEELAPLFTRGLEHVLSTSTRLTAKHGT
jgi:peptidoglycan/LPS O-acetylase OafA/YrhL